MRVRNIYRFSISTIKRSCFRTVLYFSKNKLREHIIRFMKKQFKQWWLPPILTRRTITSPLNSLNIKKTRHMMLEIQVLAWDRHRNVAGLKQIQKFHFHLDKWVSNGNTHIIKRNQNPAQIRFLSNRRHTITKMNDIINMDSTEVYIYVTSAVS